MMPPLVTHLPCPPPACHWAPCRKLLGWSVSTTFADCQMHLPPSCTLIAGYSKKQVQQVKGAGKFMPPANSPVPEPFFAPAIVPTSTGGVRGTTAATSQQRAQSREATATAHAPASAAASPATAAESAAVDAARPAGASAPVPTSRSAAPGSVQRAGGQPSWASANGGLDAATTAQIIVS